MRQWPNCFHNSRPSGRNLPSSEVRKPCDASQCTSEQGCKNVETLETCFSPLLNFGSHIWLAGPKAKKMCFQPLFFYFATLPLKSTISLQKHVFHLFLKNVGTITNAPQQISDFTSQGTCILPKGSHRKKIKMCIFCILASNLIVFFSCQKIRVVKRN